MYNYFMFVFIFRYINKMDVPVERVLVAVRVRPLSDKENKKNAFSVVQALPHEPKVNFILDML